MAAEAELARLRAERLPAVRAFVQVAPQVIAGRFLAMVDELEARLDAEDPENSRPALIEAIGDRIVLRPDASGRFLWAEYGLQGELLASLGGCRKLW